MNWQVRVETSPFGPGTPVRVRKSPISEQIARTGRVLPSDNGKVKVLLGEDVLASLFAPDDLECLEATAESRTTATLNALQQNLSQAELEELWGQLGAALGGRFASVSQKVFHPLTDGKKEQGQAGRSSRRFAATGWIKHGRDVKHLKDGEQPYPYVAYAWVQEGKERSKRFPKHLEEEVDRLINQGKTRSDSANVVHEILEFIHCEPKAKPKTTKA
jgi:hypothetical protein